MTKRTDFILLALFLLSLAIYAANIAYGLEYPINVCLFLGFHAVPAFCLQLLLCRRTQHWVAALPGLAILGAALFSAFAWLNTIGWDSLGWLLLLLLCIAPAVGCVLAWAVYGFGRLYRKGDIRHVD